MASTCYCVKRPSLCGDPDHCHICPVKPRSLKDILNDIIDQENEMHDPVSHPAHYTLGSIEVFDFITAWDLSFAEGNVVKYVVRAPHKGKRLQDLKKARWYLDQLIKAAEDQEV